MGDFQLISFSMMNDLLVSARRSTRLRRNYNFHEHTDAVQRFLNALVPNTYVRPHRHINPPRFETFLVLRGRVAVAFFDNEGRITGSNYMGERCEVKGIDICPGVWHTLICLEDAVIFEVKEGPYQEDTDKEFAIWSPNEGSPESEKYLVHLIANIGG